MFIHTHNPAGAMRRGALLERLALLAGGGRTIFTLSDDQWRAAAALPGKLKFALPSSLADCSCGPDEARRSSSSLV